MQKTNFKTRLLALLTAVFMVIVSIPFAAFADNGFTVSFFDVETKTAVGDTFKIDFDPTDNKVEVSNDVAKGTLPSKTKTTKHRPSGLLMVTKLRMWAVISLKMASWFLML